MTRFEFVNRIIEHKGLVRSECDDGKDWSRVLKQNQFLNEDIDNIDVLRIFNISVSEGEIQSLGPLKKLKSLAFSNVKLSGRIFDNIQTKELQLVGFYHGTLSEEIGDSLRKLHKVIGTLGFTQMDIPDIFYEKCSGIGVRMLLFTNTPVSENNLDAMLPLMNLESVSLENATVTDKLTSFINHCPKLKSIAISKTKIRCEFIRDIIKKGRIESLEIQKTELDDTILSSIVQFDNLRSLRINDCMVTDSSIAILKTLAFKNKECYIYIRSNGKQIFSNDPYKLSP